MEYDVFISCRSKDYLLAEKLYSYLKDNGFYVFLSSKELRLLKDAEYLDAISEALGTTYHLIVLGSSKENIKSKWVKFEWSTFLNEKLSGRKFGQIITFLDGDLSVEDLPIQLRQYESFNLNNYENTILRYLETPAYCKRQEKRMKIKQIEEERIKKQKEYEQFERKIKAEIIEKEAEFKRSIAVLNDLEKEILQLYQKIGKTHKICPICRNDLSMGDAYCKKCGWVFYPIFQSEAKISKRHLLLLRGNWNELCKKEREKSTVVYSKQVNDLERENVELLHGNEQYDAQSIVQSVDVVETFKEKKLPKKKLRVYDIANIIIPYCSYKGSIFVSDKLVKIGFQTNKCIEDLNSNYGISISNYEIANCKTYGDLKSLIATKAGLLL